MTEKEKKKSSFGYLGLMPVIAAPLFLCNPDYTLIDVLPDFIGYFLLMLGLAKLRDLNSYFETAADKFGKMALVTGIKPVLFFLLPFLMDAKESETMVLIIMLLFSIGELILIIPAFRAFFEAFSFSGFSYKVKKSTAVSGVPGKTCRSWLAFLTGKYLITLLPEFSVLASHTYSDYGTKWEEYTGLFRLTAIAVILVWGIIILIKTEKFLIVSVRDTETLDRLSLAYRETVLTVKGLFIRRRIALLGLLVCGTVIFSADFLMDNADLLPDFIAAVLFLLFFILGGSYIRCRLAGIIVSSFYIPLTAYRWWATLDFRENHVYSLIQKSPSVYADFQRYYPVCIAEAVVEAVLTVFVVISLEKIISGHCGYLPENVSASELKDKKREICRFINRKLNIWAVAAFVSVAVSGLTEYVSSYTQTMTGKFWPTLSIICSVISLCLFLSLNSEIRTESGYKYMLS